MKIVIIQPTWFTSLQILKSQIRIASWHSGRCTIVTTQLEYIWLFRRISWLTARFLTCETEMWWKWNVFLVSCLFHKLVPKGRPLRVAGRRAARRTGTGRDDFFFGPAYSENKTKFFERWCLAFEGPSCPYITFDSLSQPASRGIWRLLSGRV